MADASLKRGRRIVQFTGPDENLAFALAQSAASGG
jgi:hypothetical protein